MKITKKRSNSIVIAFFAGLIYMCAQPLDINKIDTSNYYQYDIFKSGNKKHIKGKNLYSNFIRHIEAISIISNVLEENGHKCQPNVLYKLDNGQYITLDIYDAKNDIGFIYVEIVKGGGKEMRSIKSPYLETHNADYVQCTSTKGGKLIECVEIKTLPPNIHILWAEWYWFQFTENKDDDKYLITKEIIEKILKIEIIDKLIIK